MSRDMSEIDFQNLTEDDLAYFDDRPWLKEEFGRQTGTPFDSLDPRTRKDAQEDADESTPADPDPDDNGEEGDPYVEWEYPDLKAEVKERGLEPESQSKESLIAALEADDKDSEEA